jgi:hypothetical protein
MKASRLSIAKFYQRVVLTISQENRFSENCDTVTANYRRVLSPTASDIQLIRQLNSQLKL